MTRFSPLPAALLWAWASAAAAAGITVTDDAGTALTLPRPAERIVSLSPHATEILFSAGAGGAVVGAAEWSNYPEAARRIRRVGDTYSLDVELILSLRPDLVVGWMSGNGPEAIARLRELDLNVYVSEPGSLEAIAGNLRDLGLLTGNRPRSEQIAADWLERLDSLRREFSGRRPVSVFYQIWNEPVFTVNGDHIISDVMEICGGRNVFAALQSLSAPVALEAVLSADPQVIIASGADAGRPAWLDEWNQWPSLRAVQNRHLYSIPPELIQRHTLRILDGARMMCEMLSRARGDAG